MLTLLRFKAEFYDIWIKFKTDYIYDSSAVDYHKPWRGKRSGFFYSQRFLLAAGVSVLFLCYATMLGFIASFLVAIALRKAKIAISTVQAALLEKSQRLLLGSDSLAYRDALSFLSQSALIQAAGVQGILLQAFEFLSEGGFKAKAEWAVWLADTTLEQLTARVMNTGMAASLIAMLVGLGIVVSMFRSYKSHIFDARVGKLAALHFDRHSVRPTAASELPGIMAAHTLTGVLSMFMVMWLVLFFFSFDVVRTLSWNFIRPYFLTLLGVNVFWFCLHFVFSVVIRDGYDIRSRWVFSLFDFVETFLSCVTAILYAVVRLLIGWMSTLLLFMNPAVPLMGWTPLILFDFSFKAWRALVLNDAYWHNPVLNVFVSLLLSHKRRKEEGEDEDSLRTRNVRNLFWHALILARYPSLRKEFGGRAGDILSKPWVSVSLVRLARAGDDLSSSFTDSEELRSGESMPLVLSLNNDNNDRN